MSTSNELHKLLNNGFSDEESLIKQSDIDTLIKNIKELDASDKTKGYTIPPLDTIGMNLYGKLSCQIKDI